MTCYSDFGILIDIRTWFWMAVNALLLLLALKGLIKKILKSASDVGVGSHDQHGNDARKRMIDLIINNTIIVTISANIISIYSNLHGRCVCGYFVISCIYTHLYI